MRISELYRMLRSKHGARCEPDSWWPIYHGHSMPPRFERVITNVLVQQSRWKSVKADLDRLAAAGLLTPGAIRASTVSQLAEAIQRSGLRHRKAATIHRICSFVVSEFSNERRFLDAASPGQLLSIAGVAEQTADRILLYSCNRMEWPVDSYCLRVFTSYGVTETQPLGRAERRAFAQQLKDRVASQMPRCLHDWQRLHALMQLEGERLPKLCP